METLRFCCVTVRKLSVPERLTGGDSMGFDVRLNCLRIAINENWEDLEAGEENDALVVRLKPGAEKFSIRER